MGRHSCNYEPIAYSSYSPWQLSQGSWETVVLGSVTCNTYLENINSCFYNPSGSQPGAFTTVYKGPEANTGRGDEWFWVEDMAGAGGFNYSTPIDACQMNYAGAGAGGGTYGKGGILGGGADWSTPTPQLQAGYAGGGGASGNLPSGGPLVGGNGLVILYW